MLNESFFADTTNLRATFEVLVNGELVHQQPLDLPPLAPQEHRVVELPLPSLDLGEGDEAFVKVRFQQIEATAWAEAGHEVAWGQFSWETKRDPSLALPSKGRGQMAGRNGEQGDSSDDQIVSTSPPPPTRGGGDREGGRLST